ncbi:OmpA family protein [Oscillospiraceae bacterium MB08-C2-2]|nr:OmpA family protein [Oscillospiraceae bacterium MB08-C2-2]
MAFDLSEEEEEEEGESYLASYSDLVTDLMAVFVLLFSFAMMATAQQNYAMKQEMEDAQNQSQAIVTEGAQQAQYDAQGGGGYTTADQAAQNDLDMIYEAIKNKIQQSEFSDGIALERGEGFITFNFKDNILFYPDSPVMRTDNTEILEYMGELLLSVQSNIQTVAVSGHTAKVSEDAEANTVAWRLSSDRAIAILQFFVDECDFPESKMTVAGYAHYRPVGDNNTEEGRAQNRRVEIKISREDF